MRKAARKRKREEKIAQKEANTTQDKTMVKDAVEPVEQPMSRIERRRANAAERRRRISEEMSRRNERDNDAAGTATQPQDKMSQAKCQCLPFSNGSSLTKQNTHAATATAPPTYPISVNDK